MSTNVLYTWVGLSDLRACKAAQPAPDSKAAGSGNGPVADALHHLADRLDEAVLLYDQPENTAFDATPGSAHFLWLKGLLERAGKRLTLFSYPIVKGDPTAFGWVYDAMRTAIATHEHGRTIAARHYLVGPGTPTMAACTLIIARLTSCTGTLWQTDQQSPQGCRHLELPFDFALADAPDPAAGTTERAPGMQSKAPPVPGGAIVRTPSTRRAWQLGRRAAMSAWPVLILGNTGTGKEELARHIHRCRDASKPFRAVNCGALPANLIEAELFGYKKGAFTGAVKDQEGIFEAAKDGTVFLDEIGEMPLEAQTRLLRVLQEGTVVRLGENAERKLRCRIIAATHRNLWQAIREGRFRADLYYRLAGIIITLDDLERRPEDLREMIDAFWQQIVADNPGFPGRILGETARQRLLAHRWPGNVRELKATLVRAAFLARGPHLEAEDIERALDGEKTMPPGPDDQAVASALEHPLSMTIDLTCDYRTNLSRFKHSLLQKALERAGGNKTAAARMLKLSVQHFGRLLKDTD